MTVSNFSTEAGGSASAATGAISITFPSVNLGYVWTGSLQIPTAVSASVIPVKFTAFDAGVPIGSWYNDQSSGNIQVFQQLSVTATGLVTGTYRAFFKGMVSLRDETPPFWPGPTPAPPAGGFTTLVSGLGNAVAISANPQYLTATGGLSATPVWFPVIVGTALEIAYFGANAVSQRLTPLWSTTGTGAGTIVHNADIFDLSFVSPNNVMQGLTYLNHGPFVAFLIQGIGGTPQIVINTGLPPLIRPPSVSGGDLTRYNATIADGADSGQIFLPPYIGDAQLFLTGEVAGASPAAGAIFASLRSQDYLGASAELARVGATTQMLAASGTTSLQPGYIWKMSPRINSIQVYNRIGGGTGVVVDMAISVSGP